MDWPNAKEVRVPKPEDRLDLVKEYHERTGHWGCKRTGHLLCQRHWVKTHYAKEEALLHPLDIKSFMYRWSLDLLKPGKVTPSGHRWILVITEHYTRFVVAVPLPDKEASTIAWAFKNHVLSVFEAPAEALVDGGGEFEGEFEKLCESCLIDKRVTSPDSPEGNGHRKGGVAPFTMLFAQEPTVPPDLKGSPALEFDTMPESYADTRVVDLLARAEVVKRQMIHAGCNLEVAQHRDQRRCQQHRSGAYVPKPHRFAAGDFVYAKSRPKCGLEAATKPAILKVVDIKDTGVVTLEDRTGLKEKTT
eukprot:gene34360-biopygen27017